MTRFSDMQRSILRNVLRSLTPPWLGPQLEFRAPRPQVFPLQSSRSPACCKPPPLSPIRAQDCLCRSLRLHLPHPPCAPHPTFVDRPRCFAQLGTMAMPAFLTALAPLPLAPSPRAAVCTRRAPASRRPAGLRMLGGATPPTPPPADGDDKAEAPAAADESADAAAAPEATTVPDVPAEGEPAADAETTADDILSSPAFLKKKMEVRSLTCARPRAGLHAAVGNVADCLSLHIRCFPPLIIVCHCICAWPL